MSHSLLHYATIILASGTLGWHMESILNRLNLIGWKRKLGWFVGIFIGCGVLIGMVGGTVLSHLGI